MNEQPSPPELHSDPIPASQVPGPAPRGFVPPGARARSMRRVIYIVMGILALTLAAQWWTSRTEINDLRRETAQRLQSGDSVNSETKIIVKTMQESMKELQAKVNVLESKQVEGQSQQLALEQLYLDLSKSRDDWALAEIEQVLSTASQQLQLAGNVRGALIALQNADTRLSTSDKPQFITIRRAIGKDLETLKALPSVDLTGLALRLDSVIGQIDGMPLLSDEKPALPPTLPKTTVRASLKEAPKGSKVVAAVNDTGRDWMANVQETWQSWTAEMWDELRQLIRVRTVETPDALLLSPTQAYYARENLKLRLLNARLALLSRNESAFRSDLIASQDTIARYFDTRARQTQTAQALLKQVQASNLSIEMPTLAVSLNAVRNYKAKP